MTAHYTFNALRNFRLRPDLDVVVGQPIDLDDADLLNLARAVGADAAGFIQPATKTGQVALEAAMARVSRDSTSAMSRTPSRPAGLADGPWIPRASTPFR